MRHAVARGSRPGLVTRRGAAPMPSSRRLMQHRRQAVPGGDPPPSDPGAGAEALPLLSQLEGDKDGPDTFVTSAGVVQDVEEEDARVGGRGGRPS
jgi:hypothetical protein